MVGGARRTGHAWDVRGFTLLEVLTVIVIIGLLAAVASPSFVNLMRDRGVSRATLQVADMFRIAKARALERELVLVRWSGAGGPGGAARLELHEVVVTTSGAQAPTCTGTAWGSNQPGSRLVAELDLDADHGGAAELETPVLKDPDGNAQTIADICFTGRGRTSVRYQSSGPFIPLSGVLSLAMKNKRTGFLRTVFVAPNSVARTAL